VIRIAVLLFVPTLVAAGCSLFERAGDARPSTDHPEESMTLPGGTGKPPPSASRELTGTLGFDDVEGGCWYLETGDGTRYQVIWPDGWSLDAGSTGLVGPGGQGVPVGGTVTIRGSVATGMSSTCQIGPIFRATEVLHAAGS
jgi:hypothetical protein